MPDISRFTLSLTNAERKPATEPNCYVGFQRTDDTTAREARSVAFPPDRTWNPERVPWSPPAQPPVIEYEPEDMVMPSLLTVPVRLKTWPTYGRLVSDSCPEELNVPVKVRAVKKSKQVETEPSMFMVPLTEPPGLLWIGPPS